MIKIRRDGWFGEKGDSGVRLFSAGGESVGNWEVLEEPKQHRVEKFGSLSPITFLDWKRPSEGFFLK